MNNKYYIISNNPKVLDNYKNNLRVKFCNCDYLEVLYEVRKEIHLGSKLLTHPLSGSMKPNQTPYRSIILSHVDNSDNKIDYDSLVIIENSIESALKFMKYKKTPIWKDNIKKDFQTVDLSFISNCIIKL